MWSRASSRLRRHPVRSAAALVVLLWALGTVIDVVRIRSDLNAGRGALSGLSVDRLGDGLAATVDRAADRLDHAEGLADRSPFLAPLRLVPGVRDQVGAVRDLTGVAAALGQEARRTADEIDVDLERAGAQPAARLDLLDTVTAELDRLEGVMASIELDTSTRLIAPLRRARAQVVAELDRVPERLDEARQHVAAVRQLLAGPSRYLVLAANNAEMRGGAGMPLTAGVLTIRGGDFEFGKFDSIANRWVKGVGELVPEEWATTYRQFRMGQSWLQTAVSPSFTTTGPIYAAMSAQFPTGPVDGVLEVDAVALRLLLEVIGPVELDGKRYTASNIEQQVLNEPYRTISQGQADVRARREVQGKIASAIFDAIKERDVEIGRLATALQTAAEGRHLLAWSGDPGMQALWDSVGATGELPPEGLMVTVQNISASKLDWYIDPSVAITAHQGLGTRAWTVRVTVSVPNPPRPDAGPGVESYLRGFQEGWHRAMIAVYLPAAAYDIHSLDLSWSEAGEDPPLHMRAKRVYIAPGATESVSLEFKLPAEHIGVLVLPSGRVRPMRVEVNQVALDDATTRPALFVAPPDDQQPPAPPVVAALLALAGAAAMAVGVRGRLRTSTERPLVSVSEPLRRAPILGAVLLTSAFAVLVTAALVSTIH